MKLCLLAVILLAFISIPLFSQVQIETRDGLMYYGYEIDQPDIQIMKIIDDHKIEVTIPKSQIKSFIYINSIIYYNGEKIIGNVYKLNDSIYFIRLNNNKDIKLNKYYISSMEIINKPSSHTAPVLIYPSFGLSIGNPGGFNIVLGYMFDRFGLRLAAGNVDFSYYTYYGYQGNLIFNLQKSAHIEYNLSFGFGYMNETETITILHKYEWTYGGIFLDLNVYGIFIEGGVTWGKGSYSEPHYSLQLGYVYRLND